MGRMVSQKSVQTSAARRVVATGLCAALYTVVGIATFLGVFTPVVGVVRFWPSVFVPAIFSMLFDPLTGGMGAAIGIFLSDLYVFYATGQTNPLLSVIAGVPSNFLGFYILGRIGRSKVNWNGLKTTIPLILLAVAAFGPLLYFEYMFSIGMVENGMGWVSTVLLVLGIVIFTLGFTAGRIRKNYLNYYVGGTLGLLTGAAWIGLGIWFYSQLFGLPLTGVKADLALAFYFFLWVFGTEIPFILVVPPVLDLIYRAYPFLKPVR
ncbi:MAG: ECF transporter S component [Thermoproteota archaeon]